MELRVFNSVLQVAVYTEDFPVASKSTGILATNDKSLVMAFTTTVLW